MEVSMLQKAEGFKYLYKEQFKEFGKLMEKRDKELEMDNNYRRKLWNDSLDKVNSNLVNIDNVITELEGSVNNLAHRKINWSPWWSIQMSIASFIKKNHQQKKSQTSPFPSSLHL